jgi:glyoxylase I family protein
MIRGIHHIAMHTPNFDRMVRFYGEAFGFKPVAPEMQWQNQRAMDKGMGVEGSAGRLLMLQAGNCYLEMFEFSAPRARNAEPLSPNDHGYTHFCVAVTDLGAECKRLQGLGMTFPNEPFDGGDTKAVYGKDIDGNIIELMEVGTSAPFRMSRLKDFEFA